MTLAPPRPSHHSGRRRRTTFTTVCRVLLGMALVAAGAGPALAQGGRTTDPDLARPAITLVPHEARYDMRLIRRAPGSPVVNARGTMTYRLSDTCDGWAMESRTEMSLYYKEGEPVLSDWTFISWESKDAGSYRFRIRSERNGHVDRIIDGRAEMTAGDDNGGGIAHFTQPEEKALDLAGAVMLPGEHTLAVLRAAADGQRVFTVPMFDGSETEGAMQATAVIAEAVPAGTVSELPEAALLAGPSWRMVLGFFAPDENTTLPEYEVRLRYHTNGVAEEVIQDFGTMALRASLVALTPIKDDGC